METLHYESDVAVALAGAGNNFSGGEWGAWVDCIDCGRRDRIRNFPEDAETEVAENAFKAHGWTIGPTRCPSCVVTPMTTEELLNDLDLRIDAGVEELKRLSSVFDTERLSAKIEGLLVVKDWLRSYRTPG